MLDKISALDTKLFLFLNGLHSPFWDNLMWYFSGKYSWVWLYALLLAYLVYLFKWRSVVIILGVVLVVTLADQISVKLFKDVFERLRPCHNPTISHLVHTVNDKCGGRFGFVSSHASNTFAVAAYLLFFIRKQWFSIFMLGWALLVSYSRIYLGVHYPADVFGGAILGIVIGWCIYYLVRKLLPLIYKKHRNTA